MNLGFFVKAFMLGIGMAMDAFSVSLTNGLNEIQMKTPRMCLIAGTYGVFQFVMPMIGWVCVSFIYQRFERFQPFIPYIALGLLLYIGIDMLLEGIRNKDEKQGETDRKLSFGKLMVQGIATSIDALSIGFTIAAYTFTQALVSNLIIGLMTFVICLTGIEIGKKVGTKLAGKASVLGGVVLICLGIEIFVTGVFF